MRILILMIAITCGSVVYAQSLSTDLKYTIKNDKSEDFKRLLNEGNLNKCFEIGNSNYTLLALTIKLNAIGCFNELIKYKVNLEKSCSSKTPLMYAAKYGNFEMAKVLIEAGANLNAENDKGQTAIDYAKKYQQKKVYDYFKSLL